MGSENCFEQLVMLVNRAAEARAGVVANIKQLLYLLVDVVIQCGIERHEAINFARSGRTRAQGAVIGCTRELADSWMVRADACVRRPSKGHWPRHDSPGGAWSLEGFASEALGSAAHGCRRNGEMVRQSLVQIRASPASVPELRS